MADTLISCDWGTSTLRLRLLAAANARVLAEHRGNDGVASVASAGPDASRPRRFADVLGRAIAVLQARSPAPLDNLPVVISGMAGSTIGWRSLPYAPLPFDLLSAADAVCEELAQGLGRRIILVSGVRSDRDIMRGEETELLGLWRLLGDRRPARCRVVLPGTHSKHARIAGNALVGFKTFMTGELFAALSRHSVLRHSTAAWEELDPGARSLLGPAADAFRQGVREAMQHELSAALFRTRTRQVLDNSDPVSNTVFLSGLLIGAEIDSLRRSLEQGESLILCAGQFIEPGYRAAIDEAGLGSRCNIIPPNDVERLAAVGHAVILSQAHR